MKRELVWMLATVWSGALIVGAGLAIAGIALAAGIKSTAPPEPPRYDFYVRMVNTVERVYVFDSRTGRVMWRGPTEGAQWHSLGSGYMSIVEELEEATGRTLPRR